MKSKILLIVTLTISTFSFAQSTYTNDSANNSNRKMNQNQPGTPHDMQNNGSTGGGRNMSSTDKSMMHDKTMKDGCEMKDGKVSCVKNGKSMMVNNNMTLNNGTVVSSDGTVKMKDGKTMQLKEGDCIDMNGKMCPKKSMNKMDHKDRDMDMDKK